MVDSLYKSSSIDTATSILGSSETGQFPVGVGNSVVGIIFPAGGGGMGAN